ncbi:hypothetical protein L873DRAFT_1847945 [Choiromyces venosus 120613-1]|uniref:t-SNARE coiled-coil homology domain-containing protein n=1 Tax=Choiromyces venosus 120613-1 TaxID=1336337 RepID=A0A3N4J174_9PEZI|nr:hypothetical protein L873DRAFT_1847945 [Choiromyces venosus 120613-1]
MFRLIGRPAFKLASTYHLRPKVNYPCRAIGTTLRCNTNDDSHHDYHNYHASNIDSVGLKSDSASFTTSNKLSLLDKDVFNVNLKLDNFESREKEMKGEMKKVEGEIKDLSSRVEKKFAETDSKMERKFDKTGSKIDKTGSKIDETDGKMERQFDKIYDKIDKMCDKIHKIDTKFSKLLYGIIITGIVSLTGIVLKGYLDYYQLLKK